MSTQTLPKSYESGVGKYSLLVSCPICDVDPGSPCIIMRSNPMGRAGDMSRYPHFERKDEIRDHANEHGLELFGKNMLREVNGDETTTERTPTMNSRVVLEQLVAAGGRACTNRQLAEATGLSIDRVNGSLGTLRKNGLADRIAAGIYRASHMALGGERSEPTVAANDEEPVAVLPERNVVVSNDYLTVHEDDLDAVLEVMFPNGIPARSFSVVNRWREHTREMITELNS